MHSWSWACGLVLGLTGCVNCHVDGAPTQVRDGITSEDQTFYMSSRWEGPLLHFPGGRRYAFYHGLKAVPETINAYLAFHRETFEDEGSASESAGNQAIIECVSDTYIVVRNDTCAEFYVRLVAELGPGGGVPVVPGSQGGDCQGRFPELPDE